VAASVPSRAPPPHRRPPRRPRTAKIAGTSPPSCGAPSDKPPVAARLRFGMKRAQKRTACHGMKQAQKRTACHGMKQAQKRTACNGMKQAQKRAACSETRLAVFLAPPRGVACHPPGGCLADSAERDIAVWGEYRPGQARTIARSSQSQVTVGPVAAGRLPCGFGRTLTVNVPTGSGRVPDRARAGV
jgi:hypothetical protein